jgi:2-polyprenyl-3-methyl-5-hydroxy-6-metoxy-1,4-benzoquinol methylase
MSKTIDQTGASDQPELSIDSLNFFGEGSPFLNHPFLTADRTAQEVDFVEAELAPSPGPRQRLRFRLLDVGCGFGRHSIELARRRYEVVGLDQSAAMIKAARQRASAAGVTVEFRQELGQHFRTDKPFDGAICLYTTLGQITTIGENSGLVQRVFDALRPGGCFIVEVPQRGSAVSQLKPAEKYGHGDRYTAVTRRYDDEKQTIVEVFVQVTSKGNHRFELCYRLYDREELLALMTQAGFTIRATHGSFEGKRLVEEDAIMVVVGQK